MQASILQQLSGAKDGLVRTYIAIYQRNFNKLTRIQSNQVPKKRIEPKGLAVLITGCDTGFGNLLARKLDKAGFKVFACCLFPSGVEAKKLKSDTSARLRIINLDVTSDQDAEEAYREVERDLTKSGDRKLSIG